ncbi:SusC/RagA family TonB-linked outer membrane protein [Pedobacter hiemivivus]|uniref:Uncharacterized protein n=1 Tax=Pedobacter hiemivivus TaxID=2530454 RepID=A0A4R0NFK0_9SPHI|nr:TonB-dependent receptor [Pedobacter hiemivivus]TCC98517.1 hypothetical protein EZ444_04330 [Pedobacter hiemivivus]
MYPHERILYDQYLGLIDESIANHRLDSLASLNNRSQIEKYFQQPALLTNHNVTVSGGGSFHNYYGSVGYTNERETDKSNASRYNINLRQNFTITPKIKLDLITSLSQEDTRKFNMQGMLPLNSYLPYAMFADGNGNGLSQADLKMYDGLRLPAEQLSRINLNYNPLDETRYAKNNNSSTTMARVNAGLTINLLKGLNFEGRYQYQTGSNTNYTFTDQNNYFVRNEVVNFTVADPLPVYYLPATGGHYQTGNARSTAWAIRNQLTYDGSWNNEKHRLTILAGTETRKDKQTGISTYTRGYNPQTLAYEPYDERTLKSNPIMNPVIGNYYGMSLLFGNSMTSREAETRFVSFYGNMGYTFNRKYNLNASIRMDQSNLFGTDVSQQYKPIWSMGASWLVSNESFFHVPQVNSLKLRLTYGIGGNSPNPGSGGPYDILSPFPHPWYTTVGPGYQVLRPANDKLIWEKTATLNAGLDASLFNNRIELTIDVYDKKTSDLLSYQPFDVTNGWFNGYTNFGDLNNKGIELSSLSRNIVSRNFNWSTTVTFGSNKNKITRLGGVAPTSPQSLLSAGGRAFIEGYSAYSLFSLRWAGLDNTGAPQVYNNKGEKVKFSGDLSMDDVSYAGTAQPLYYGGITNNFQYKRFELSFLVIYNLGHKMRKDVNGFYSGRLRQNIAEYFENRWKQPGDENRTDIPAYIADGSVSGSSRSLDLYEAADINIVSASYARLRDLTLSYRVPTGFLRELKIYGQVNNVLLWTANNNDIDPEYYNMGQMGLQVGSGSSSQGLQLASMRPNRMKAFYTIGLNVSFK